MAALATASTVATIVAAAASVASIAYSAAQGAPEIPNAASSSLQVAQAQANQLPIQRALSAAEQQGGTTLRPNITAQSWTPEQAAAQRAALQGQIDALSATAKTGPRGNQLGGISPQNQQKIDALNAQLAMIPANGGTIYRDKLGNVVPKSQAFLNFTGHGTADIEGKLAQQFSDLQLELGKKYGVQFAEEAAKEAALADPEGTAARKLEYDLIQKELDNPRPINPLSGTLQDQIGGQVKAGAGLDPMEADLLENALTKANAARGGNVASGDVANSMTTGYEGQNRLNQAITKGQAFASSGSTPADIEYRREQQMLADLGSFVGGRTPESQFQNLSSAGHGAAPFYPGSPPPQLPANAGAGGDAYSIAAYNANTNAMANQANPWMAGLSALLQGVGSMAKVKPT